MEEEKMIDTNYFGLISDILSAIERIAPWADQVQSQLHLLKVLRFLELFSLCMKKWQDSFIDGESRKRVTSMITTLQGTWGKRIEELDRYVLDLVKVAKQDVKHWHVLGLELGRKIQTSKLEIEAWCVNSIHCTFQCKDFTSNKVIEAWGVNSINSTVECRASINNMILDFLDLILQNLNDLVSSKAGKISKLKMQIETLEDMLVFLKNMLKLTENCAVCKELEQFNMFVQVFANDAFHYWAKEANGEIGTETKVMLSQMLQKIKPGTTDVARLYFQTLEAIYSEPSCSLLFGQTACFFVDIFLEDLVTPLQDDFQRLRDEVIFLLTYLNNPPNGNAPEVICSHIGNSFWEGIYGLLPFNDMEGNFAKKQGLLSDFIKKIEMVNAKTRLVYCKLPDSSLYSFPNITAPGYLNFLVQNLRNLKERMVSDRKFVSFAKYKIIKIEEELGSLCSFFDHILQSELNETCLEVVNLVYLTEHVINSCISSWFVFDHPIWYHMTYLSNICDRIKAVKKNNISDVESLPRSACVTDTVSEQTRVLEINELVVGFEDDEKTIIDNLTTGDKSLHIISIVGMGDRARLP